MLSIPVFAKEILLKTLRQVLTEHKRWRRQIFLLARADIVKTYSGAALGWAWALVKPVITISVFWFAFTYGLRGAAQAVNGFPFALWMIPGFIAWFYMSDMLTQGANGIRKYRYLVTKMKFPVSTIPTFISLSKLAIHICLMGIVALIFIMTGNMPNIYWIQLPVYMLLMFLFWTSWGLFASMLGAMSRDFINLIKSISTAVFWLSGIMWDVNTIGIPTLQKVLYFNPVTYLVTGYRNCFIYHKWFWEEGPQLGIFLGMLVVMMILALWSYKKLIREIPDVL